MQTTRLFPSLTFPSMKVSTILLGSLVTIDNADAMQPHKAPAQKEEPRVVQQYSPSDWGELDYDYSTHAVPVWYNTVTKEVSHENPEFSQQKVSPPNPKEIPRVVKHYDPSEWESDYDYSGYAVPVWYNSKTRETRSDDPNA
jgi:hypothetical protein